MATDELKELHFTVGEDMGRLLTQIAREHLLYEHNPIKTLKVFEDSFFGGCPKELMLDILKGDKVILVDVDKQEYIVVEFDETIHPHLGYEKLDMVKWSKEEYHKIHNSGMHLKREIEEMLFYARFKKINKSYDYSQIIKFIAGDDEAILDDLRETEEVSRLALLINVVRKYIEKSLKIDAVIDWMKASYPQDFKGVSDFSEYHNTVKAVYEMFNQILTLDLTEVTQQVAELDNYIKAAREIDEVIEAGIKPVDIMKKWSAGWLAPNGDFYGLNGEIANMLHNQIANALYEAGIIPESEENKSNPDPWLEQNGWVKIHENNIQFAGCLNVRLGKKNVDMTPKQIEVIRDYITDCHQCIIKAGWRMERQSISMFTIMAMKDLEGLYKKYFEY